MIWKAKLNVDWFPVWGKLGKSNQSVLISGVIIQVSYRKLICNNTSKRIFKTLLYKVPVDYVQINMKCASCKENVDSPNPFLDIYVCNECYHILISKLFYPNTIKS